ncbi:MAG: class I SAM-dependent methyltransferase, partial [Methanosarcinales archaeon]
KRIKGNKVTIRRLERHIDLTISGDRAIFSNYNDWKYLQEMKGHPGTFRDLWNITKDKQRKAWEFVGIKKTDIILDVGFRDGFNLKELEKKCSSVIGIDINKHSIDHAKGLGCQVFQEDIQQGTHFENNSFDVIIMCDILEHCFSPENALKECNRLLKHRARMIIEVPFENTFNRNLLHGHASLFENEMIFEELLINYDYKILKKDHSKKARNWYVVTPNKKNYITEL